MSTSSLKGKYYEGSVAASTGTASASGSITVSGTVNGTDFSVKVAVASGATAKEVSQSVATAINDANIGVGAFVDDAGATTLVSSQNTEGTANALSALSISGTVAGVTNGAYTAATAVTETEMTNIDVSTVQGAQESVIVIDQAISAIDKQRADLGAVQNRFENTIGNLQNIAENVSAARGRIQDTDFAAETANLTKNQILQQAGTAILSQANQLPQAVLSLLQ